MDSFSGQIREAKIKMGVDPQRRNADWLFAFLLITGAGFLLVTALLQHNAFGTGYDLGIYDQTLWNLSQGRVWMTTLVYETNGFYDHFEPILVLLLPFYWLCSDVRVLLIVQSLALALGALPIYLYAQHRCQSWPYRHLLALAIATAYLVYPALHNGNLNDFHEVSLLPPLLGFALYGLLTGNRRLTWLFLALYLLVKEDFSVTFLTFGLYIFALQPPGFRRRDGFVIVGAALAWMLLVLYVFYPALTRGMAYPFVARRYAWLGDSPEGALRVLLTRPWIVLPYLLQPQKLGFLSRLFRPLLFLPLLGMPVLLIAFPMLAYLMLSSYEPQWSVQSYYNPPLLPILFFSLIIALDRLRGWMLRFGWHQRWIEVGLASILLLAVGTGYYVDGPGPGSRNFDAERFTGRSWQEAGTRILAQVPPDAAVSTVWPFVPHLSQRQRIYTVLARPKEPPDYILQWEMVGAEGAPTYPWAAPDSTPPVYHEYNSVAVEVPFRLWAYSRSIPLTEVTGGEPASHPLALAGYAWLGVEASTQPPAVFPGDAVRLLLAWRRTGHLDRRYVFFVHLLPDGSQSAANGLPQIVAQSGHEPGDGRFPTTHWELWTAPPVVLDEQRLDIPAETPPGEYFVWVGAYDKESGERIELGGPGATLKLIGSLRVNGR